MAFNQLSEVLFCLNITYKTDFDKHLAYQKLIGSRQRAKSILLFFKIMNLMLS